MTAVWLAISKERSWQEGSSALSSTMEYTSVNPSITPDTPPSSDRESSEPISEYRPSNASVITFMSVGTTSARTTRGSTKVPGDMSSSQATHGRSSAGTSTPWSTTVSVRSTSGTNSARQTTTAAVNTMRQRKGVGPPRASSDSAPWQANRPPSSGFDAGTSFKVKNSSTFSRAFSRFDIEARIQQAAKGNPYVKQNPAENGTNPVPECGGSPEVKMNVTLPKLQSIAVAGNSMLRKPVAPPKALPAQRHNSAFSRPASFTDAIWLADGSALFPYDPADPVKGCSGTMTTDQIVRTVTVTVTVRPVLTKQALPAIETNKPTARTTVKPCAVLLLPHSPSAPSGCHTAEESPLAVTVTSTIDNPYYDGKGRKGPANDYPELTGALKKQVANIADDDAVSLLFMPEVTSPIPGPVSEGQMHTESEKSSDENGRPNQQQAAEPQSGQNQQQQPSKAKLSEDKSSAKQFSAQFFGAPGVNKGASDTRNSDKSSHQEDKQAESAGQQEKKHNPTTSQLGQPSQQQAKQNPSSSQSGEAAQQAASPPSSDNKQSTAEQFPGQIFNSPGSGNVHNNQGNSDQSSNQANNKGPAQHPKQAKPVSQEEQQSPDEASNQTPSKSANQPSDQTSRQAPEQAKPVTQQQASSQQPEKGPAPETPQQASHGQTPNGELVNEPLSAPSSISNVKGGSSSGEVQNASLQSPSGQQEASVPQNVAGKSTSVKDSPANGKSANNQDSVQADNGHSAAQGSFEGQNVNVGSSRNQDDGKGQVGVPSLAANSNGSAGSQKANPSVEHSSTAGAKGAQSFSEKFFGKPSSQGRQGTSAQEAPSQLSVEDPSTNAPSTSNGLATSAGSSASDGSSTSEGPSNAKVESTKGSPSANFVHDFFGTLPAGGQAAHGGSSIEEGPSNAKVESTKGSPSANFVHDFFGTLPAGGQAAHGGSSIELGSPDTHAMSDHSSTDEHSAGDSTRKPAGKVSSNEGHGDTSSSSWSGGSKNIQDVPKFPLSNEEPTVSSNIGKVPVKLSRQEVVIGSQTFSRAGSTSSAVIAGQSFSWNSEHLMGPSASIPFPSHDAEAPAVIARGQTFTVHPADIEVRGRKIEKPQGSQTSSFVVSGQTFNINPSQIIAPARDIPLPSGNAPTPFTYNGQTMSANKSFLFAGSTSIPISSSGVVSFNGEKLTIRASEVVGPHTSVALTPSPTFSAITYDSITISVAPSEARIGDVEIQNIQSGMAPLTTVVDGNTLKVGPQGVELESTTIALPTPKPSFKVTTVGGVTLSLASTEAVVDSKTYVVPPGSPSTSAVINGQTVRIGPSGVHFEGSTVALPTPSAKATAEAISVGVSNAVVGGSTYAVGSNAAEKTVIMGSKTIKLGREGVELPAVTLSNGAVISASRLKPQQGLSQTGSGLTTVTSQPGSPYVGPGPPTLSSSSQNGADFSNASDRRFQLPATILISVCGGLLVLLMVVL